MAVLHVQSLGGYQNSTAGQTSTVLSPTSKTVTAGNVIVVAWGCYFNITPTGVTDDLGNTYAHVERVTRSQATVDLWYAPVTTGGSITTITVAHPSTSIRQVTASEFSGVGTLNAAGGGLNGTGTTATWVDNKTIPVNGLAVGGATHNSALASTAGSASGDPSTSITRSGYIQNASGHCTALFYATVGVEVTGFSGTSTNANVDWAGAGGLFNTGLVPILVTPGVVATVLATFAPVVTATRLPLWTSPLDTDPMTTTPELKFVIPWSSQLQHFYMELDTAATFDTADLRTYRTDLDQTNWAYWDGDSWEAFPVDGVATTYIGNEVRYTVTSTLKGATWYRRVRASV